MALFPSEEWLKELVDKINSDQQYAQIAKNWEGDMVFMIEADSALNKPMIYYLDLWHGKCRDAYTLEDFYAKDPALLMSAPYNTVAQLMKGELEVIQALLTRKISVKGNMVLLMRNVPTVLDFVRCCREITDSYL